MPHSGLPSDSEGINSTATKYDMLRTVWFYSSLILLSSRCQSVANPPQPSLQQTLPQCVCIPDSTGSGCLQYDSRYQAASLDEAMLAFQDLTMEEDPITTPTVADYSSCTTQKCVDCQNDIHHKLKTVGLIQIDPNEQFTAQGNLSTTCDKYRFTRRDEGVYEKRHEPEEDDDDDSSSDEDEEKKKNKKKEEKERKKAEKRYRRQAVKTPVTETIVGERFTISCSAKGITTDTTGLVSLCSSCWVWRKLPDNYTPQYINELVCDTSDASCLSGYATCGIGHRNIEAVKLLNGVKTSVVLSAGSYCECKIASSSALMSLVSGSGVNSALPPAAGTGGTPTGK